MHKKTRNSRGQIKPMETHFYTMDFFFLSLDFPIWRLRKIPYYFFLCPVSISRIINAKKNSKFERADKTNGKPLLHHGFCFFLSLDFSYEHSERLPTIFVYALLVFLEKRMQKKLEIREGRQEHWKTTST